MWGLVIAFFIFLYIRRKRRWLREDAAKHQRALALFVASERERKARRDAWQEEEEGELSEDPPLSSIIQGMPTIVDEEDGSVMASVAVETPTRCASLTPHETTSTGTNSRRFSRSRNSRRRSSGASSTSSLDGDDEGDSGAGLLLRSSSSLLKRVSRGWRSFHATASASGPPAVAGILPVPRRTASLPQNGGGGGLANTSEAELELRRESVATAKSWLARQEAAALEEDEDSASVDTSEEVDDGKQQEVDSSSTSESYVE